TLAYNKLIQTDDSREKIVICYFVERDMSDIALRKFFGFDESDLTSNRHGRLSKKQEQTIRSAESGANRIFVFAGVVFISLALGSTFGILKAARDAGVTFTSVSDLVGPLIGLALIWGLLGFL